jgi:hypothetical protein
VRRSQNLSVMATCVERHIGASRRRLHHKHRGRAAFGRDVKGEDGTSLEAHMEHTSSHSSFNLLFMVSFFASFVAVLAHFG